jgi:nicotinamidase-related amidase
MENDAPKSALLVMDMIVGITVNFPDSATLISSVGKAITHARARKLPVIYVALGFRPGTPEINRNNKSFSTFKERFSKISVEDFSKIVPELAPQSGEITVFKRRVSAFTGSDLEVLLRSQGIQHIVLSGISTSGVVLSTTREAADKDYKITILSDCCADPDPEVHRMLTTKVFPRQAEVLTLEEWSNG